MTVSDLLNGRKIRLVALDLDGTVLTSRKTISRRVHTALRAASESGVHVMFATARPPRSVRGYYNALKLTTPQINYNGALIWEETERRVLYHDPLEAVRAKAVIDFARRVYPEILVSVEILDQWYTDHYDDIPEYATETAKHFTPDFIGPIESFLVVPVTKVMLLGKPEWVAELEKLITAKFGDRVAHTRSDAFLLQIMSPGVSKGGALARVAERLGVAREEIMAVGDAPNDADMLEYSGLPIVVKNAWPSMLGLAKAMVPSNDEDGVAVAIERFVLGLKSD